MDRNRAADIIAAYGGDPARWPATERMAALQLVAGDPELGRARSEAQALDAMLGDWARRDVHGGDAGAAAARVIANPRPGRRSPALLRWAAGGGIAAALTLGVVLTNPMTSPQSVATTPVAISDEQAFAMLFTPTSDEDSVI